VTAKIGTEIKFSLRTRGCWPDAGRALATAETKGAGLESQIPPPGPFSSMAWIDKIISQGYLLLLCKTGTAQIASCRQP
jgi:hypothetical protein